MTLSYIFFGTNKRDPAEHTCPWLNITPESAPGIARDKSASGKMIFGDLPPNSSVTRFNVSYTPVIGQNMYCTYIITLKVFICKV